MKKSMTLAHLKFMLKRFFKQCEREIGINALKPGVDITNPVLPAADNLGDRDETGALVGGLK